MNKVLKFASICTAACLFAVGAAAQTDAPKEASIDPEADQRLQSISDFLGAQKAFSFKAYSFFDEVQPSGIKIKRFIVHEIAVQRPDRLRLQSSFDDGSVRRAWFNAGRLIMALESEKATSYIEAQVPATIDELIDYVQVNHNTTIPAADILYSDVRKAHRSYLLSAMFLGERFVEGRKLDHISMESAGADWQLWADTGAKPIPRRLIIDYVDAPGAPETQTAFVDWQFDPSFADDHFDFSPPASWQKLNESR